MAVRRDPRDADHPGSSVAQVLDRPLRRLGDSVYGCSLEEVIWAIDGLAPVAGHLAMTQGTLDC